MKNDAFIVASDFIGPKKAQIFFVYIEAAESRESHAAEMM